MAKKPMLEPKGKHKMTKAPAAKAEHKDQGKHAQPGSRGRSTGSEYAYAVMRAMNGAAGRSKNEEFLGVPKKTIDVTDKNQDKMLYKGKKK